MAAGPGDHELDRRIGARRLTARSVVASTLLGSDPPELPTRSLVGTAALFGIAPGTARVAMSRMVAAGELVATGEGYRLVSPALLARQERQTRSRRGTTGPWDGSWRTVVVTAEARSAPDRAGLRNALAAARFGELREGVWLRPDNLTDAPPPTPGCTILRAEPEHPATLARRLWDLPAWTQRARMLTAEVDRLLAPLEAGDAAALRDGFVLSAAVLRHVQADPLLPAELLDPTWPGPTLRSRYDRFDRAFRTTLATWQRSIHAGR